MEKTKQTKNLRVIPALITEDGIEHIWPAGCPSEQCLLFSQNRSNSSSLVWQLKY
jgi:hypothetical protein